VTSDFVRVGLFLAPQEKLPVLQTFNTSTSGRRRAGYRIRRRELI